MANRFHRRGRRVGNHGTGVAPLADLLQKQAVHPELPLQVIVRRPTQVGQGVDSHLGKTDLDPPADAAHLAHWRGREQFRNLFGPQFANPVRFVPLGD